MSTKSSLTSRETSTLIETYRSRSNFERRLSKAMLSPSIAPKRQSRSSALNVPRNVCGAASCPWWGRRARASKPRHAPVCSASIGWKSGVTRPCRTATEASLAVIRLSARSRPSVIHELGFRYISKAYVYYAIVKSPLAIIKYIDHGALRTRIRPSCTTDATRTPVRAKRSPRASPRAPDVFGLSWA